MKEKLKNLKADVATSAILCIVLGVVLIFRSEETILAVCKLLALILIVIGGINVISFITDRIMHPFAGILGLAVVLVGVWIFISPQSVASLIPIVIGVILVVHGVEDVRYALEAKKNQFEKWWSMLLMALLSVVFGVFCIIHAFGLVQLALVFIGIALVYDGVSDILIVIMSGRAGKFAKQEKEAVDVEYEEVK